MNYSSGNFFFSLAFVARELSHWLGFSCFSCVYLIFEYLVDLYQFYREVFVATRSGAVLWVWVVQDDMLAAGVGAHGCPWATWAPVLHLSVSKCSLSAFVSSWLVEPLREGPLSHLQGPKVGGKGTCLLPGTDYEEISPYIFSLLFAKWWMNTTIWRYRTCTHTHTHVYTHMYTHTHTHTHTTHTHSALAFFWRDTLTKVFSLRLVLCPSSSHSWAALKNWHSAYQYKIWKKRVSRASWIVVCSDSKLH
jgi:hypothetical protein